MGPSGRGDEELEGPTRGKGRAERGQEEGRGAELAAGWLPGPLPGSVLRAQRTGAPCGSSCPPELSSQRESGRAHSACRPQTCCRLETSTVSPSHTSPAPCTRASPGTLVNTHTRTVGLGGAGALPVQPSRGCRVEAPRRAWWLSSWRRRPPVPGSHGRWVEMSLRCLPPPVCVHVCVCVSLLSSEHLSLCSSPVALSFSRIPTL